MSFAPCVLPMTQELSLEQKTQLYDKVKESNFRESSRLEGIELGCEELPDCAGERANLKAALLARYTKKSLF